jgi:D-alanyl-D-alanine carboxypeptidase
LPNIAITNIKDKYEVVAWTENDTNIIRGLTMRKIILSLCLSVAGFSSVWANCSPYTNSIIQNAIDTTLEDKNNFINSAIQISVICKGEKLPRDFVGGTTTLGGGAPVQINTLFQVGSMTKSFIATLMLQLEAEGKLNINDPLSKWLPQLPSKLQGMTIKQLLNHTSGIADYQENPKFLTVILHNPQKHWTTADLLALALERPSHNEPGKGYHYSNSNYILAGAIIEAATHQSVEENLKAHIFIPLSLTNTYFIPCAYDTAFIQQMAHGYFPQAHHTALDVTDIDMSYAGSAGSVVSTSHDISLWLKALLTGKVLDPKQQKKLTELVDETTGEPFNPKSLFDQGYGLGIEYNYDASGGSWGHNGGTLGFTSNMLWFNCEDMYIAILTNGSPAISPANLPIFIRLEQLLHNANNSCIALIDSK